MSLYRPVFPIADNEIYVDASAPVGGASGAKLAPFLTIQDAIDAAGAGDVIHVAAGAYTEDLVVGTDVNILGFPGAVVVEGTATIEDASPMFYGLSFVDDGAGSAVHVTGVAADLATFDHCQVVSTAGGGPAVELDNTAAYTLFVDCDLAGNVGNANEVVRLESGTLDARRSNILHGSAVAESVVGEGDGVSAAYLFECEIQGTVGVEAAVIAPAAFVVRGGSMTVGAVSAGVVAATGTLTLDGPSVTSTDAANDAFDGAGAIIIGSEPRFLAAADEIATTLAVTRRLEASVQSGAYTEAAGAGARAITFAQPYPNATGLSVIDSTGGVPTVIAATGFTMNTPGNGTYYWIARRTGV